jgi:hypothetical protein
MKPADLLKKSRNSSVVAFHKFILLHRKYKSDLFCFFEGKDTHYYFPRINNTFGENHHPIICGNKNSVIKTFESISVKYPEFKTAFFVDNDFDDKVNEPRIYNTPCYSIENLYCTELVLKRILKNEFLLKETDTEFKQLINLFNENQKKHHKATSLFNVWYASAKNKAKNNCTNVNVSLNDKFPKDLVKVKIGEIKSDYNLSKIKEIFPEAIDITQSEINLTLKTFYQVPPVKKHRGKYEIEFFISILKYIIEDCNEHNIIMKNKTKFNIDNSLVLSQLSQYSETPACLIDYIKNCA